MCVFAHTCKPKDNLHKFSPFTLLESDSNHQIYTASTFTWYATLTAQNPLLRMNITMQKFPRNHYFSIRFHLFNVSLLYWTVALLEEKSDRSDCVFHHYVPDVVHNSYSIYSYSIKELKKNSKPVTVICTVIPTLRNLKQELRRPVWATESLSMHTHGTQRSSVGGELG